MQFTLFLALLMGFGALQAKSSWTIGGVAYNVDTLIYRHQVGPGSMFTKYDLPDAPLRVSVVEMDLTNKYVDFETCKGGDRGVCEEQPTNMYSRNDRPGHDMIAATNGDFYFYTDAVENGIPRSGQFKKDECITNPVGRAAFVLTDDRMPYIDRVDFAGKVTFGTTTTRLHTVNMQRLEWEDTQGNQLNMYTNSYGTETENCSGGTKVIIVPKSGNFFWSANKDVVAEVKSIIDGNGVTQIPDNSAVLWGRGTSQDFLKTLSVGSEITINLKTDLRSQPGAIKDFGELMGGSDHIILKDGNLVDEWEDRHPRTCIGYSNDRKKVYFVVIDGRQSFSRGASLAEAADVFKAIGANNAVNLDGGGSTIMIVNGDIVNSPSDGTVRAVGNGCLVVSNAPVDDVIGQIAFAPRSFYVPIYSKITPQTYGYNKYGVLKSRDLKGVVYTCDASIGKIVDGTFIAGGTPGSGNLTATYNGITYNQNVTIIDADLSLRLSQVYVDKTHEYPIEVYSTNGVNKELIDPSVISWTSSDPSVCTVDNGIVKALANGKSTITGVATNFNQTLNIVVENPVSRVQAIDPNLDVNTWTITQSGGSNRVVTALDNGLKINFTGASGRAPSLKLTKALQLYGIPDTIRLRINPGELKIDKVTMNTATPQISLAVNNIAFNGEANKETVIDLPISKWCDAKDFGNYPITLNSITFTVSGIVAGKAYEVAIPGIEVVYNDKLGGVEQITTSNKSLNAYPNPINQGETAYVNAGNGNDSYLVSIYNNGGALMTQGTFSATNGVIALPTTGLGSGIYFIALAGKDSVNTLKLIVK